MSTADPLYRRDPGFYSWQEYDHFLEILQKLTELGDVQEIAPSPELKTHRYERWFVEKTTGRVFQLVEPNPPGRGWWCEVSFPEHFA